MSKDSPITLTKAQILYVLVVVLVVLPAVGFLALSPAAWWCRYLEMPTFEQRFGFRLGTVEMPASRQGAAGSVTGITWVEPSGVFARAGVRPGDIPRTHHGLQDFCSTLAAASAGEVVELELLNVKDAAAGQSTHRLVRLAVGTGSER